VESLQQHLAALGGRLPALAACRTYPARLRKSGIRPEFPLVFVICVHTNSSNS
jgi:hypothetical protein